MPHTHPKPPLHESDPRPSNPNSPATKDELNLWADQVYHYLLDLRQILNDHVHATVPPAHQGGKGGTSPARGLSHIGFPPEPPWEMS